MPTPSLYPILLKGETGAGVGSTIVVMDAGGIELENEQLEVTLLETPIDVTLDLEAQEIDVEALGIWLDESPEVQI